MVAYSFKKQFIGPIERGEKRQTIRAHRKRHARPGEFLQLYFGMRTKHCRKIIDDTECVSVDDIGIRVNATSLNPIRIGNIGLEEFSRDKLARADGFDSIEDMHAFWLKEHGEGKFEGVIIKW